MRPRNRSSTGASYGIVRALSSTPKERARLAELFFLQAEDGSGVTASNVDVAIKRYHAKEAHLEVKKAEAKAKA